MGKGSRDECLLGKVLGDLDHLLLLTREGILDVSRGVLDRMRLDLARDVSGGQQIRHCQCLLALECIRVWEEEGWVFRYRWRWRRGNKRERGCDVRRRGGKEKRRKGKKRKEKKRKGAKGVAGLYVGRRKGKVKKEKRRGTKEENKRPQNEIHDSLLIRCGSDLAQREVLVRKRRTPQLFPRALCMD